MCRSFAKQIVLVNISVRSIPRRNWFKYFFWGGQFCFEQVDFDKGIFIWKSYFSCLVVVLACAETLDPGLLSKEVISFAKQRVSRTTVH